MLDEMPNPLYTCIILVVLGLFQMVSAEANFFSNNVLNIDIKILVKLLKVQK